MSNKIDITKAKIDKDFKMEVEYSEQTSEGVINHVVKGASQVHDDLRIAYKALVPHAASLCEVFNKDGELDTENIILRGINISTGNKSGYVFTMLRELSNGKKIVMNTPLLSAEADEETYEEIDELRDLLNTASEEVRLHVFEGKKAADAQADMFAQEEETEGEAA